MDNKTKKLKLYFDSPKPFDINNIKTTSGLIGIYFIFTNKTQIQYPFKKSRLLYIGMSEKKTNSIGKRLMDHFDGTSRNLGLINYKKLNRLFFTYFNFEMLKKFWNHSIEDLESYFILDFVNNFGVYPICNNKTGFEIQKKSLNADFEIDWSYFK
jgi:hypothetical protein